MILPRSVSLPAVVLFGTLWAAVVVEVGLWMVIDGPPLAIPRSTRVLTGVGTIAAGLVVFMIVVADRLFPAIGRRSSMLPLEMTMMLVFLLAPAAGLLSFCWGI